MNYRNISHFAEGLVTAGLGRGKASLNSYLIGENIRTHTGSADPREGQDYLDDDDYPITADINAVYELSRVYYKDGAQQTYREYVISAGVSLWGIPLDEDVCDELNAAYPLDSDDIWAAEYMDWMWICNGKGGTPVAPEVQEVSLFKYDAIDFFQAYIEAPAAAPGISTTGPAVAGMTGYRGYKYRYVRFTKDGSLNTIDYVASPMSEIAYTPNLTGVNSPIVSLVASTDPQVGYIELYCTLLYPTLAEAQAATFYRLDYAAGDYRGLDNINQNHNDTTLNATITGTPSWHPAEDTTISWTNPPEGLNYITYHKDRLYAAPKGDPSAAYYCDLGVPESWHADNWLGCRRDDGDKITGFCSSGNDLYIFKERSIFILTGDPDSAAILQIKVGGERTGAQTEFGLGCTAPRSIATYGDDAVIFYSKVYGVYMISGGQLFHLSSNVSSISSLPDSTSGAVYTDANGAAFYVLSPQTGNAWVFHLASKKVMGNDTSINVSCFCVNHNGELLGGSGKKLNHFYDPDSDTDNGVEFIQKLRTAWVNLRNGEYEALLRGVQFQTNSAYDAITMTVYDESEGERFSTVLSGSDRSVGIDDVRGRLFSLLMRWTRGSIESLTLLYRRRKIH